MKSLLVAGEEKLKEFCLENFLIPDPIIIIWKTENKPSFGEPNKQKSNVDEDISLFFKEHLYSLFFPNGFKKREWNLVLVVTKNFDIFQWNLESNDTFIGWMMGSDINTQTITGEGLFVKFP